LPIPIDERPEGNDFGSCQVVALEITEDSQDGRDIIVASGDSPAVYREELFIRLLEATQRRASRLAIIFGQIVFEPRPQCLPRLRGELPEHLGPGIGQLGFIELAKNVIDPPEVVVAAGE